MTGSNTMAPVKPIHAQRSEQSGEPLGEPLHDGAGVPELEERLALLAEASRVLADASLEPPAVMERLCALVVPTLGEACTLSLLDEDGAWLRPVASAHARPEAHTQVQTLLAQPRRADEGLSAEVLRTGHARLLEDATPEQVRQALPALATAAPEPPATCLLVLPLRAHGRMLGTLSVSRAPRARCFAPVEQLLLQELADRAAVALDVARAYERERRAREALRDAHQTLEAIIQASPAAIALMDLDGTVRLWNPAAERIFGWTAEETVGHRLPSKPETERDELASHLERVAAGEALLGVETRRRRRNGAPIDVALWGSPVRHATGKVQGLFVMTDITAQKRSQDAQRFLARAGGLLASSLDYEVTLERVAHLAVPTYAEGCYVYLLGEGGTVRCVATAHAGPAPVKLPRELGSLPPGMSAVSRVISSGEPELRTHLSAAPSPPREDGPRLPCELAAQSYLCVPLLVRGQVIGALSFVSSARDFDAEDLALTRELARAAALAIDNARLYREARQAVSLREEFLSIAGHELKTPITALQLQVQSLLTGLVRSPEGPSPERLRRALETVGRQVNRQTQLVNDLLDVSRISAGRLELHPEAVHLSALCREVAERFEPELARTGSTLRLELSPEAIGFWDRLRLDQVVTNLLSNAVKYGRGNPIHLSTEVTEERVRLVVQDSGIGIAGESLSRLFNRFERAVSERHYGGFGLGLWIARQIVEAMGGRIAVESELSVGSTFTVELPRTRG